MVKTVKVTGYAYHQNGEPAANAKGVAILSQYELDDGVIVPHQIVFRTDEVGSFNIDLWPNERGTGKSFYEVIIYHKSPEPFEALIYVPDEDHDVRFKDILVQLPPPPISDAERILQEVMSNAYASSVSASESAESATIATNKAQDAANSASAVKDIADDSAKSANIAATLRDETASLRQQTHSLKENADASASAALASQNAAKTSETNSKASEVAAKASATASFNSAKDSLDYSLGAKDSAASASSSASAASTFSTTAQGAATTATNAAVDAGKSSDNAADSASSAESAKDDAYSYLNKAEQWASKLGSPVEGDEYSAKYWAKHAEANSNVKFATETVVGISRFGTQEEVIDGELDNVIVSPKYLKEVSDTKVDKVSILALYDDYNDRFGTLTKAIKLVYTEDVTISSGSDIEVSYEGVVWSREVIIPKNTPVFIRNVNGSSELVDLTHRQYISEIIFWGNDITRLSLIGGTLLSKVPLTIPNALTNMSQMFEGCSSFNQNISTWAVGAKITDMTSMFKGCSAFNQDLSSWIGTSALYIDFALGAGFENNPEKHPLWAPPIEFEVWREDLPPKYVATTSAEGDTFYEKEGLWFYVAPVTNNMTQLSQLRSIVELYTDLEGDFPTVDITDKHGVTKSIPLNQVVMTFVSYIYQDVSHRLMVTLGNSNFNQYIGSWDLSNCTSARYLLYGCSSFNQPLNLDLPNCTDASSFLFACSSFNQPLNLDLPNCTSARYLLYGCSSFNQDISNACVPKLTSAPTNWNNGTPTSFQNDTSKHPVWGTCPSN